MSTEAIKEKADQVREKRNKFLNTASIKIGLESGLLELCPNCNKPFNPRENKGTKEFCSEDCRVVYEDFISTIKWGR